MSGICGIVYKDQRKSIDEDCMKQMTQSLAIRPDQKCKVHITGSSGFGLASGYSKRNSFSDANFIIVCEGEFYNKQEIIKSLGNSETGSEDIGEAEISALLYRKFGPDMVNEIQGVFSIAVCDIKKNALFLATDPFAIKQISYYHDDKCLIFGSKIRAILNSGLIDRDIDSTALLNYFFFHAVPTPCTIYKDIHKLPPGHYITLNEGNFKMVQYWDINYLEDMKNRNEDQWTRLIRKNVESSVRNCLDYNKGENFGAFLSGGTDSSTIAGMAKDIAGSVKTFSIGFSEKAFNEMSYARITARHFNTEHYEYFVTPEDAFDALPSIIKMYDEPFGNASVIPSYYCAKLAMDNDIDVLLAGDGGDEIFAGNERYVTDKMFSLYQEIPSGLRKGLLEPLFFCLPSGLPFLDKVSKYLKRSNIPNPKRFFSYNFLEDTGLDVIFDGDFIKSAKGQNGYWDIINSYYGPPKAEYDLNRNLYMDLKLIITDNDLVKVNGAAELAGITVRYPLLDKGLVEFSGTIPSRLKIKWFKNRFIFKDAMKNYLPHEVITKKKHGFGLPISIWLKKDKRFRGLARDTLLSRRAAQRGYFRKGFIEDLFKRHEMDNSNFYGDILWVFLIQELWHREHYD